MSVILETSLGDVTLDLYTEERPKCSENFLKLCKIKYYNWSLFHSVQRNLVAQTGDPTCSGRGGGSVYQNLFGDQARYFDAEIKPRIKHKKYGTVSMVNNGSNMHGSQFFITLAPDIDYLDGQHTVFGEVAEGIDVLDKFNEVYVDKENRPYKDVRIYHTVVIDDPFDDPKGLEECIPPESPVITLEQIESDRIGAEEEIDDYKGKTEQEVDEIISAKEAKANAQILEMVGDLPDAEVAPEDNVLFVCKLNPVTTAEDLEIIFSRFGAILSCEVIKDEKTGESLQYAFIEFQTNEHCENAYFKMDNVLIDDRRIHVDFSQSVAKLKKDKKLDKAVDSMNRYIIKGDKKRKDGYDLVFSDNENDNDGARNKYKKLKKDKKKKNRHRYSSEEAVSHSRKKSHQSRSRSVSPVRRQRRSPSPRQRKRRSSSSQNQNRRSASPPYRRKLSSLSQRRKRSISHTRSPQRHRNKSPNYKYRSKHRSRSHSPRRRSPTLENSKNDWDRKRQKRHKHRR